MPNTGSAKIRAENQSWLLLLCIVSGCVPGCWDTNCKLVPSFPFVRAAAVPALAHTNERNAMWAARFLCAPPAPVSEHRKCAQQERERTSARGVGYELFNYCHCFAKQVLRGENADSGRDSRNSKIIAPHYRFNICNRAFKIGEIISLTTVLANRQ